MTEWLVRMFLQTNQPDRKMSSCKGGSVSRNERENSGQNLCIIADIRPRRVPHILFCGKCNDKITVLCTMTYFLQFIVAAASTAIVAILTISTLDTYRMKDVIGIQWACLFISAMSGAASLQAFVGLDDDDSSDDDTGTVNSYGALDKRIHSKERSWNTDCGNKKT